MRRRLLVLSPFPPRLDAAHGGGRATAQKLLAQSARHDVGILYLRGTGEPDLDPALHEACAFTGVVERRTLADGPRVIWTERQRIARRLRGDPDWVVSSSVAHFPRVLRHAVRDWRPHLVQAEFLVMAQYPPALGHSRPHVVVVDHDPAREDASRWARYAQRVSRTADALVVFTDQDAATVQARSGAERVAVIPLGYDVPPGRDPVATEREVLFAGSFIHEPNVEAARRLAFSIRPHLDASCANVRVTIVGADPPADLVRAADSTLVVTGAVPDVRPYLDRAAVVVAPLHSGGGQRVKVMDALAAGKALVATPLALSGFDVRDGIEVVVADGDEDVAQALCRLLDDEELRSRIAANARRWAEANLGWDRPLDLYDELYESL